MNIHEYQAKQLLAKYGVSVPRGGVAYTPEEAVKAAGDLGGSVWVVKAQIHAGGRGKAGGVKVVKSVEDVRKSAADMIGMTLVTHQTGAEGREVKRVYIEEGCDIKRELYLGMLIDRATAVLETVTYAPRYHQHFNSNVRVTGVDPDGTIHATSNYMVLRTQIEEETRIFQSGRYFDKFVRVDGELKLKSRDCVYDTLTILNALIFPV